MKGSALKMEQRGNGEHVAQHSLFSLPPPDDPVCIFKHQPQPPHSVLKFLQDIFASKDTASIFYHTDMMVLIDILVRQIADLSPGDKVLTVTHGHWGRAHSPKAMVFFLAPMGLAGAGKSGVLGWAQYFWVLKSTLGAEEEGRIYPAWHTSTFEERSARLLVVCTLLIRDLWEEKPSVSSSSRRNLSFGVARGRGCTRV